MAQRVGRGIALLFHDHGTRRGWVVSSMPQPHFTPGKDLIPIVQEAGWAPGPVWTGGKSRPHRNSIPDHPALSQYYKNIGLLKHGLQVMASWWLRKCSKCPPWVSMQVLQEIELWKPTLFHQIWLGLFTTVSSEMSFHSCCKIWICRLGFIYGLCLTVLHHIPGNSWTMYFWNNG